MGNIFAKLQKARTELSKIKFIKSGRNTFSKYDYFELKDILPDITNKCQENGIVPIFNFGKESASLVIKDTEPYASELHLEEADSMIETYITTRTNFINKLTELCNKFDINLKANYVLCFGKGSKERLVPIGEKAITKISRNYQLTSYASTKGLGSFPLMPLLSP